MPDPAERRDSDFRSGQPATQQPAVGHPSTQIHGSPQVEGSPQTQGTTSTQSASQASQATTRGYPQGPSGPGAAAATPGQVSSGPSSLPADSGSPGLSGMAQGAYAQHGQPGMSHRGHAPMSPWDMATSRNPFSMMRQFADEMDRLFESFGFPSFGRQWPGRNTISNLEQQQDVQGMSAMPGMAAAPGTGGAMSRPQGGGAFWAPQIDVSRRGNELVVCADLPGMNREDIQVEVRDDQLILQGERRWEQEQGGEDQGYYRSERSYGRFFRAVPLPDGVNPEQAQASFKDGVLEIKMQLPERQEPQGRRIEIR